jgi:hypothetical protein
VSQGAGAPPSRSLADALVDGAIRAATTPAALAGIAATLAVRELRLPGGISLFVGAAVAAAAGAVTLWTTVLSMPARLRRAMRDVGLVERTGVDHVRGPLQKGRSRRSADTLLTRWLLPPGLGLRAVHERQDVIEQRLSCELSCWMDGGLLHVELLRRRIPDRVDFAKFYAGPRLASPLAIGLGVGRRGPLWADLSTVPHLLVGGMTGGGKSVFLTQALTGLLLTATPDELRLVCIDLKGGVELTSFGRLPHALTPVADTVEAANAVLTMLRSELDCRLAALRASGHRDLDARAAAGLPRWPRVLVPVDELAELTLRDHGQDKAAREHQQGASGRLCEIARLGRAAGIHLLCCTQRPDAEAVPGQLKANLAGTVAFRVRSRVNSQILLDSDRAAMLPPRPGRAVWAHERIEEFQAVYISAAESERLLCERWGTVPVTPCPQKPGAQAPLNYVDDSTRAERAQ